MLNWTIVCHPRECGGMDITNLRILNQTIFYKWWWKLLFENPKPWSKLIIKKYYCNHLVTLKILNLQHHSSFWKQAHSVRKTFQALIKFNVGNGQATSFWNNTWYMKFQFKICFHAYIPCQPTKTSLLQKLLNSTGVLNTGCYQSY